MSGAIEAFLAIYHNLPFSVLAIIDLLLFFGILSGVIVRLLRL